VGFSKWTSVVAACVVLTGCSAEVPEEPMGETENAVLAGDLLTPSEVATHLRNAGWPENLVGKMTCVAKWESSFFERARNGRHYGLWQISWKHLGETPNCPRTAEAVYDAAANARCALSVYRMQGIRAWSAYSLHRRECDRYPAPGGARVAPDTSDDDGTTETPTEPATTGEKCFSGTLQREVEEMACVQSSSSSARGVWFQCLDGKWYRGGDGTRGVFATCTSSAPLAD